LEIAKQYACQSLCTNFNIEYNKKCLTWKHSFEGTDCKKARTHVQIEKSPKKIIVLADLKINTMFCQEFEPDFVEMLPSTRREHLIL
jgi:hypothetical protein